MAVQIFDIQELVRRARIATSPIDSEPFRIRVTFEDSVNRTKRIQVIKLLRSTGYKQVGNTSSWVLNPELQKVD
jgi:hypothetical protein